MQYMTIGLKRKVSLILLPIDDFTGRIITGSKLRVYLKEENVSSIRKQDGYHIFCNISGSEAEICLEGPLYQKQILRLPIGQEKPKVYPVRMFPGIAYPLPKETTIVSGTLPEGGVLKLVTFGQKRGCKLLHDYDPGVQGESLSLFRPFETFLVGRTMCIRDKEKNYEFFKITDQKGNICIPEHPLSKTYRKIGTGVYPVYEITGGEDGEFRLPINGLTEEEIGIGFLMRAGIEEKSCEISLMAGKENRITEDMWKEVI